MARAAIIGSAMLILLGGGAAAEDATGTVILSIGEKTNFPYQAVTLHLRSTDGEHTERAFYSRNDPRDFVEGLEAGCVTILSLPAGTWEIYSYDFEQAMILTKPGKNFSVPFTVVASETRYIGHFAIGPVLIADAHGRVYSDLGMVVDNQGARDVPLARVKGSMPGEVRAAVVDATAANSPAIQNRMIFDDP